MNQIRPVHWSEAEAFIGHRLDRRRSYAIGPSWLGGDGSDTLLELVSYTSSCSGCCEGGEYGGMLHLYRWDDKAECYVGSGCRECGHTGKRRNAYWIDIRLLEVGRAA